MRMITLPWETWRAVIAALRAKGLPYMAPGSQRRRRLRGIEVAHGLQVHVVADGAAVFAGPVALVADELAIEGGSRGTTPGRRAGEPAPRTP